MPVLTEMFHILGPASHGSELVREFVVRDGLGIWHFSESTLLRAFELMKTYADHPMDLADASLVTAAETLRTRTVFTIDRSDFLTYRAKVGRTHLPFSLIPAP